MYNIVKDSHAELLLCYFTGAINALTQSLRKSVIIQVGWLLVLWVMVKQGEGPNADTRGRPEQGK